MSEEDSGFFGPLEKLAYSAIEYLPGVGELYSFGRAGVALSEGDNKRMWASLVNGFQGICRDVVMVASGLTPITAVAVLHSATEAFMDTAIDTFIEADKKVEPKRLKDKASEFSATDDIVEVDKTRGYVIIAGHNEDTSKKAAENIFNGKMKGVSHFQDSVFTGTLTVPQYAPDGVKITLHLPQGLRDGALCNFVWRWATDAAGRQNRAEYTFGRIELTAGNPTKFKVNKTTGYYPFWGEIKDADNIVAKTDEGGEVLINMTRVKKES